MDGSALVADHGPASAARDDREVEEGLGATQLSQVGGFDGFEEPALGAASGTAVVLGHDGSQRGSRKLAFARQSGKPLVVSGPLDSGSQIAGTHAQSRGDELMRG